MPRGEDWTLALKQISYSFVLQLQLKAELSLIPQTLVQGMGRTFRLQDCLFACFPFRGWQYIAVVSITQRDYLTSSLLWLRLV